MQFQMHIMLNTVGTKKDPEYLSLQRFKNQPSRLVFLLFISCGSAWSRPSGRSR